MPDNSSFPSNLGVDSPVMAFNVTRVCVLLPLSTVVLFLGYRRWRQQRSSSHADMFTYHNAALELICNVGTAAYVYGTYADVPCLQVAGLWFSWMALCGEICFHLLTCVERYLAVVRPVTYRALGAARGVRLRNVVVACVWLLCLLCSSVETWLPLQTASTFSIQLICILTVSLLVVSFCSVSVLLVLVRPGPGDVAGDRQQVDQPKRRAFVTVATITAALSLWFVGLVAGFSLDLSFQDSDLGFVLRASSYWFMMPGSLVLPLLYLYRTGHIGRNSGSH